MSFAPQEGQRTFALRRAFAQACRSTSRKLAARFRSMFIHPATELSRLHIEIECCAVTVGQAQVGPVFDEMDQRFCCLLESRVITAGHPNVPCKFRETTGRALLAIGNLVSQLTLLGRRRVNVAFYRRTSHFSFNVHVIIVPVTVISRRNSPFRLAFLPTGNLKTHRHPVKICVGQQ